MGWFAPFSFAMAWAMVGILVTNAVKLNDYIVIAVFTVFGFIRGLILALSEDIPPKVRPKDDDLFVRDYNTGD